VLLEKSVMKSVSGTIHDITKMRVKLLYLIDCIVSTSITNKLLV
jgi:hypothetical protein